METAIGRVDSVHDGIATVMVDQPVACPRCASGRGCGAGLLTGSEASRHIDVRIPPGMGLASGDTVRLAVAPRQLLRAAFLAYGVPLLAILLSVGVASATGIVTTDLGSIGFALAGLGGGLYLSRRYLARDSACAQFIPVVDGHTAEDGA